MLAAPADSNAAPLGTLHPFLVEIVRRSLAWRENMREINSAAVIEAYLVRLNKRMARIKGTEAKIVTLHHIAPLIVTTIATFANVAVATRVGADHFRLPPLQDLYNEAMASLSDPNGILGKQFVDGSCTLVDQLLEGRVSSIKLRETMNDVPRGADSGLPVAAFTKRERAE
ncbi:hypothetical protein H9P43_006252 [Blastocladiella emersonii ATCC 22665]|nr:hypothetical protein H9P43_006252 [Blastocladiella emersonii ATCC 22665]